KVFCFTGYFQKIIRVSDKGGRFKFFCFSVCLLFLEILDLLLAFLIELSVSCLKLIIRSCDGFCPFYSRNGIFWQRFLFFFGLGQSKPCKGVHIQGKREKCLQ